MSVRCLYENIYTRSYLGFLASLRDVACGIVKFTAIGFVSKSDIRVISGCFHLVRYSAGYYRRKTASGFIDAVEYQLLELTTPVLIVHLFLQ